MPRVAVIDTGSNAIRLAIARPKADTFELLYKLREPIRLGADVFEDGRISPPLLEETAQAFKKFKKICDSYDVDIIRAIATSALRDAKNQKDVVQTIETASGIHLDVISGDRESDLVFKAICHEIDLRKSNALLIDIGGGSVELVGVKDGKTVEGTSFPIGTVRLLTSLKKNAKDYYDQIKSLENKITTSINYIKGFKIPFHFCVGIGGNIERMGKVNGILSTKSNPKLLTLTDLIKMYDVLAPFSLGKRMKVFDLKADQADVIIPAIVMCIYFMQASNCQELRVPGVGIKDGVILEELKLIR